MRRTPTHSPRTGTPAATARSSYAVRTADTKGHTPVSALKRFDGSNADETLAGAFVPTGAVQRNHETGETVPANPDVLQVITEEEAEELHDLATAKNPGIDDVFPYGFVVTGTTSALTVLLNQGDGAFYYHFTNNFGLPSNPSALALADMDGDGDLDVVVGVNGRQIKLYRNR